jgi:hypothetical protein
VDRSVAVVAKTRVDVLGASPTFPLVSCAQRAQLRPNVRAGGSPRCISGNSGSATASRRRHQVVKETAAGPSAPGQ